VLAITALTGHDLDELQRLLVAADIGATEETFEEVSQRVGDLGQFVRQLVGLDRAAAKQAFAAFLDDKRYSGVQIRFVNLIIEELTSEGIVNKSRLFDSPYKDLAGGGPDDLFVPDDLGELLGILEQLNTTSAT
jgi:type I restriction enzyme, R subunit